MNKPIVLLGLPGSGKTYWGKKLATHLGVPFYDLDRLICQEAGLSIKEIFEEGGESLFRSIESSTLFTICQNQVEKQFVLALGGGTPAFNNNMSVIRECCTSIFLNLPIDAIHTNLKNDRNSHRPLLEKADDNMLYTLLKKLLAERELAYNQADYMLMKDEISLNNFERIIKDAS